MYELVENGDDEKMAERESVERECNDQYLNIKNMDIVYDQNLNDSDDENFDDGVNN